MVWYLPSMHETKNYIPSTGGKEKRRKRKRGEGGGEEEREEEGKVAAAAVVELNSLFFGSGQAWDGVTSKAGP